MARNNEPALRQKTPLLICSIRTEIPYPCMGSSANVFRMSISSVPWTRSLGLSGINLLPLGYQEEDTLLPLVVKRRNTWQATARLGAVSSSYSYRSATMGSTRAARRAGIHAAASATASITLIALTSAAGGQHQKAGCAADQPAPEPAAHLPLRPSPPAPQLRPKPRVTLCPTAPPAPCECRSARTAGDRKGGNPINTQRNQQQCEPAQKG